MQGLVRIRKAQARTQDPLFSCLESETEKSLGTRSRKAVDSSLNVSTLLGQVPQPSLPQCLFVPIAIGQILIIFITSKVIQTMISDEVISTIAGECGYPID